MKALFSFALVCAFFSMTSFTTLKATLKAPSTISSWPLTGTTATNSGTVAYSISGSGQTPGFITFYNSSNASIGSYPFISNGANTWLATGMKALGLGINGVQIGIFTNQAGYTLDFYTTGF